jgi:mono/diheme cytochrome c family protein
MRLDVLLASLCLSAALACGEREAAPPAAAPPPASAPAPAPAAPAAGAPAPAAAPAAAAVEEAKQIFATRCFTCHGSEGAGDGPGSVALTPKPRNFQDGDWQDSVTDEHIDKIIKYGGAAVGKSPTMPGNPDLMAKPEVVRALVAHVRGLRR